MDSSWIHSVCYILALFLSVLLPSVSSLRIGAFNVRVFGKSKASKPDVMNTLSKIIRRYDIILIQEIRDSKGTAIQQLLDKVNRDSKTYSYGMIISDRVGRTNSKEQYAFFYRNRSADGIEIVSSYMYDDGNETLGNDVFEREPFLVKFHVKPAVVKTFALGAIHVKPEQAVEELTKLGDVFTDAKSKFKTENVIILGDLNADCSYVPKKDWPKIPVRNDPAYHWLIGDEVDTTVKDSTDCAYDRFILTGTKFYEAVIRKSVRVFRFDKEYKLNEAEALEVSDHYPIELELSVVMPTNFGSNQINFDDKPVSLLLLIVVGILGAIFLQRRHN